MKRYSAFTLIELVVVMLLLAIVAVYATSRYLGPASFSPFAAQQQAISIIRQLQIHRMQSNGAPQDAAQFQLVVSQNCLGSKQGCDAVRNHPEQAQNRSDVLLLEGLSVSASPAIVTFDLLGNPYNRNGVRLNQWQANFTSSKETQSICINRIGYVSVGACQ